jgi:hypothetical protein
MKVGDLVKRRSTGIVDIVTEVILADPERRRGIWSHTWIRTTMNEQMMRGASYKIISASSMKA